MKHILILGKYYPPERGGVERYTSDVAGTMSARHRVTVVVHNTERGDSIEQRGNVTVVRCGTWKIVKAQPISPSMLKHLRGLDPDLVHFNAPNFWAAAMLLLAGYKAPLVVTHHADVFGRPMLRRMLMPLYHQLIRRASGVVVTSLKNAASSQDLPRGGPFIEIPWGLNARDYALDAGQRADALSERRRRFGNAPTIGFVGRFVRYKGLSVLVDALARLDGAQALLVGDGPLRAQIEQQVQAAGIADRVHFLGNLDDQMKIRTIGMMDLLVLPSTETTEAFGVAQVEAQLMGLPVVASRLPTGVTDITVDGETGFLVTPGDPKALADAITKLIRDPALSRRLGLAGHGRALDHFTIDRFAQRMTMVFEAILSNRPFEEFSRPSARLPLPSWHGAAESAASGATPR